MISFDTSKLSHEGLDRNSAQGRLTVEARETFEHERGIALRKMRWGLRRAARRLCTLSMKQPVGRYVGQRTIRLSEIVGTENRSDEFDIEFHPIAEHLESRWVGVWSAFAQGLPMPPVELLEKDGCYYVRDGHHRISVARALGIEMIDAVVTQISDAA